MNQLGLFAPLPPSVEGIDVARALASYSADVIAMNGRVRKPVPCGGDLWVNVGSSGTAARRTAQMYRVVPVEEFDGTVTTYTAKTAIWRDGDKYPGDYARNDPQGFYHGMAVKNGSAPYVLCGPSQTIEVIGLVELLDHEDEDDADYPDDYDDEDEEEDEDEFGARDPRNHRGNIDLNEDDEDEEFPVCTVCENTTGTCIHAS